MYYKLTLKTDEKEEVLAYFFEQDRANFKIDINQSPLANLEKAFRYYSLGTKEDSKVTIHDKLDHLKRFYHLPMYGRETYKISRDEAKEYFDKIELFVK